MKRVIRVVSAPLLVISGLLFAGCASDAGGARPGGAPEASGAARQSDLPAVSVVDVGSGEAVTLSALFPSAKPLLVWFWAPH